VECVPDVVVHFQTDVRLAVARCMIGDSHGARPVNVSSSGTGYFVRVANKDYVKKNDVE